MEQKENIKIDYTSETGSKLEKAHPTDACFDIRAMDNATLKPGEHKLIKTGLKMSLPKGFVFSIRPRSGFAYKNGVTVLNSPGTVDSDYRGDVGVILINHGKEEFKIKKGDRIAQGIVEKVLPVKFILTDELDKTERGEGGYGSTGVK